MKSLIVVFLLTLPVIANAQYGVKRKSSYGQGTLFLHWGYNRSGYTKSNIRFRGVGYDFRLKDVDAQDNPRKFGIHYFDPRKFTIPQFNIRLGYYFKDKWAISLGYDHMKYVMGDGNNVLITGFVEPGVDDVSNLSGNYQNQKLTTDRNNLHYENSDGLNYIRAEITRTDMLFKFGKKGQLALSSNLGAGAGALLSFNDFRFAGQEDRRTISLSGYGISAHVGLRVEFFRHIYLQSTFSAGIHHQVKVRTRPNDRSAAASHAYGYIESSTVLGALFYIRPTNGCDSCPIW